MPDIHNLFNIGDLIRHSLPDPWGYMLGAMLGTTLIVVIGISAPVVLLWIERKLIGRFQVRYGPNRVGPYGLMQSFADAIKLLVKEAITPAQVDKWVYFAAPVLTVPPALLLFAVLPLGPGMVFADLSIGLLFILAISSLHVIPVFMAGWSSNNKYSLLGAMRAVAQMVSYEIPQVLSLIGVVMLVGSLRMTDIVQYQLDNTWLVFLQPLAFLMFFISSSAELNRTPTDIMEGESEIVAGYHTEYSGFKFAAFQLAEYIAIMAVCTILTVVFFGGWALVPFSDVLVPFVPAWLITIAKVYFFFTIFVWTRATLPRMRIDQLMAFSWKFLLPLALMNIGVTAVEMLLPLPTLALVILNMVLTVVLVVGWANVVGTKSLSSKELRAAAAAARA